MRNPVTRCTLNAAALLGLSLAATGIAHAQANATATRGAEVNAFAHTTLLSPDYGQTHNFGYSAGVEYNRIANGMISPGIVIRMTSANGNTVSQRSYMGGLQFRSAPLFRAQPYFTVLAGSGTISYTHAIQPHTSDQAYIYAVGAGADFPIRRNLKLRADFLQQTWSYQPHNLTPVALSIGVSYTILGGATEVR